MNDKDVGKRRDHGHRNELRCLERQLRVQERVDNERRRRKKQRMSVRFGSRHRLGAYVAGSTGAVFDDHGLTPFDREPLADHARDGIHGSARWKSDDETDRSDGVRLSVQTERRERHGA